MIGTHSLEIPGYQVIRFLGGGARSTIWQVRDRRTGRVLALKRVVKRNSSDDRFLEQAVNEYEVGCRLEHPALRRVFDMRQVKRWLSVREVRLWMEYCDGRTIQQRRPDGVEESVRVFLEVASGLAYMNERGFVHADTKPNNIIVAPGGSVKVIDFGQSCPVGTVKKRIQGTPDFIAPEQLSKKPLDARTDIYNLGTTMYKVLTGKVAPENIRMATPLGNGTIPESLSLAKFGVRHHNAAVPERLAHIVEKCSRRSRSKRYQNMREVEQELLATLREIAPPDHRFIKEAV